MTKFDLEVPYISKASIAKKADQFRIKYSGSTIPVDIESIVDVGLKIDIIPTPELIKLYDTEAFISMDGECLYVDKMRYENNKYANRYRFSLAHEIGHKVLHSKLYKQLKIDSVDDYYNFIINIDEESHGYLETQANIFANNLLVPRERLIKEKKKILRASSHSYGDIDKESINKYISIPLAKIFQVDELVIEIALNSIPD